MPLWRYCGSGLLLQDICVLKLSLRLSITSAALCEQYPPAYHVMLQIYVRGILPVIIVQGIYYKLKKGPLSYEVWDTPEILRVSALSPLFFLGDNRF